MFRNLTVCIAFQKKIRTKHYIIVLLFLTPLLTTRSFHSFLFIFIFHLSNFFLSPYFDKNLTFSFGIKSHYLYYQYITSFFYCYYCTPLCFMYTYIAYMCVFYHCYRILLRLYILYALWGKYTTNSDE